MVRALALALLFASCSAAAMRSMPPKEWRSQYGYQKLRWGMPLAEVRRLYPTARKSDSEDVWTVPRQQVAGLPVELRLYISDDRLHTVGVVTYCQTNFDCQSRMVEFVRGLREKYGPPQGKMGDDPLWRIGALPEAGPYAAKLQIDVGFVPRDESGPAFVMVRYTTWELPFMQRRARTDGL